jgi:cysteine desulfuration protein SufE
MLLRMVCPTLVLVLLLLLVIASFQLASPFIPVPACQPAPAIVSDRSLQSPRTRTVVHAEKYVTSTWPTMPAPKPPSQPPSVSGKIETVEKGPKIPRRAPTEEAVVLPLPPKLEAIVASLETVSEKLKYQQLLFMAQQLPPMNETLKTRENKVQGCLSVVHVDATIDPITKVVTFVGDSDGLLTKGLVALLVSGLTGLTSTEIQTISPSFITRSGLGQGLTPGRSNGFLAMLKMMKTKARLVDKRRQQEHFHSCGIGKGPFYEEIIDDLMVINPTHLVLVDETPEHADATASKGLYLESQFSLNVTARIFENLDNATRHNLIFSFVGKEKFNAFKIHATSPSEYPRDPV